jgi:hypothetical protein
MAAMECRPDVPGCSATPRRRVRALRAGKYGRAGAAVYWGKRLKRKVPRLAEIGYERKYPRREFRKKPQWHRFVGYDNCVRATQIDRVESLCKQDRRDNMRLLRARAEIERVAWCGQTLVPVFVARGKGLVAALPDVTMCPWRVVDREFRQLARKALRVSWYALLGPLTWVGLAVVGSNGPGDRVAWVWSLPILNALIISVF